MADPGQFAYTPPTQPGAYGPISTSDNSEGSTPQQADTEAKATNLIVQEEED